LITDSLVFTRHKWLSVFSDILLQEEKKASTISKSRNSADYQIRKQCRLSNPETVAIIKSGNIGDYVRAATDNDILMTTAKEKAAESNFFTWTSPFIIIESIFNGGKYRYL